MPDRQNLTFEQKNTMRTSVYLILLLLLCAGSLIADTEPGNNLPGTTPDVIVTGIGQTGSLGGGDQYDYFQLNTSSDGNISIHAINDNNAYIYIYLYDNDGVTQLGITSGYGMSGISFTASGLEAGTYYAMIYSLSANNYTLTASLFTPIAANDAEPNNTPAQATSLSLASTVSGHIAYRANGGAIDINDYYSITTTADGDITIHLQNENNAYNYFYLYDNDGTTQLQSGAGYAGSVITLTTNGLAAGTYFIRMYSTSYCGYTLTATLDPNPLPNDPGSNNFFLNASAIAQNDSINGHIAYRNNGGSFDNYDIYSFYSAGDYDITINLKNNNNAYNYIYLFDTDTTTQLSAMAGYAQTGISFTATGLAAGTYYIMVYAGSGSYSGYTLKNTYTPNSLAGDPEPNNIPAQAQPFAVNSSLTGHIAYRNTGGSYDNDDYYQLITAEDGNLQISFSNTNNAYSYVYLYDMDGITQISANTGYGQSGFSLTANGLAAGTYYVRVYGGSGSYCGYTLSNTLTPTPYTNDTEDNGTYATAQILNNSPVKTGHIGHRYNGGGVDSYDYRKITMLTTDSLRIELSFSNSNYAYIYLYNAAQNQLYSNSGFGGSYVIFFNSLPAGDYYLVVYGTSYNSYIINEFYYPCDPSPSLITAGGPLTFCEGGNVTLNASLTYNSYLWSNSASTASITTGISGNYYLTGYDYDGCPHVSNILGVTALPNAVYYADTDGDTFGDQVTSQISCTGAPLGYVTDNTDCDDGNAGINPGATESCNNIDDNCNGATDEGLTFITYYVDADNDNYGSTTATQSTCNGAPSGYVSNSSDCDDANNNINPAAAEICNGIDDNCNGSTDEGCGSYTYFADTDADGYGDPSVSIVSPNPVPPTGYVADNSDCDDGNPVVYPTAPELCNNIDDNCNGLTDDGLTFSTWYADADGDGYGDATLSQSTCSGPPSGYVTDNTDCNDTNANIYPGAAEICNGADDNCDGVTDEGCTACAAPGPISGPSQLCAPTGQHITYSIAPVPGAISYQWSVPAGTIIVSGQGTTTLVVRWPFQVIHAGISGDICVSYSATCGTSAPSCLGISVELSTPVRPASLSGPNKACNGDVFTYSTQLVPRATQYNWTVPQGAVIQSGNGTNIITVVYDASFTGGQISVTASNGCGTSPARSRDISRNILKAPASVNGLAKGLCGASGVGYTCAAVIGAISYHWTVPAGASIASGQGTSSITVDYSGSFSNGIISVYAVNNCGGGAARTLQVSAVPSKPGPISGPTITCSNQIYTYEVPAVPGTSSYNWTLPSHLQVISGQGTKTLTVQTGSNAVADFTISVKCSNACGSSPAAKLEHISTTSCPRMAGTGFISDISAYPNPVSETFRLKFWSEQHHQICIEMNDASGRRVYFSQTYSMENENGIDINVSGMAAGIYTLTIRDEDSAAYLKIAVE